MACIKDLIVLQTSNGREFHKCGAKNSKLWS